MSELSLGQKPKWLKFLGKVLYKLFRVVTLVKGGDTDLSWSITFYKERDY